MTMFQSRTAGDVIAEIKMNMTTFDGGYLLVEGPSDSRFFGPKLSKNDCQIVICGAKHTVVMVAQQVKPSTQSNSLGVVDDDFDSHMGIDYGCSDLISTETHDIETLMLSSSALDRVLLEYADPAKIQALELRENKPFINSLLDRSVPFGKLRYISALQNLNINFSKYFSPWVFIDHKTWDLDLPRLLTEFQNHSNLDSVTLNNMYNGITNIPEWNLSQGHDVVNIFSIAFNNVIKAKNNINCEEICSALRLTFSGDDFTSTALFEKIKYWENTVAQKILS